MNAYQEMVKKHRKSEFTHKRLEQLWPQKKHENIHQVSGQGKCDFFYLRKSSKDRQTKLNCWDEMSAVHLSLVPSKRCVLGDIAHHQPTSH